MIKQLHFKQLHYKYKTNLDFDCNQFMELYERYREIYIYEKKSSKRCNFLCIVQVIYKVYDILSFKLLERVYQYLDD